MVLPKCTYLVGALLHLARIVSVQTRRASVLCSRDSSSSSGSNTCIVADHDANQLNQFLHTHLPNISLLHALVLAGCTAYTILCPSTFMDLYVVCLTVSEWCMLEISRHPESVDPFCK